VSGPVRVLEDNDQGQSVSPLPGPLSGADHPNWRSLVEYCQRNPFVSMRVNFANGVPVSAEEVVPTLRFDKPDPRGKAVRPGSR
jgi:hypothetical protein